MGTVLPASLMAPSLHRFFLRLSFHTVRFLMLAHASLGAHQPFWGHRDQGAAPAAISDIGAGDVVAAFALGFAAHQTPSRDGDVGCCRCSVNADGRVESPAGTGGGSWRAGEPLLCVQGSPTPPLLVFLGVFCSFAAAAVSSGCWCRRVHGVCACRAPTARSWRGRGAAAAGGCPAVCPPRDAGMKLSPVLGSPILPFSVSPGPHHDPHPPGHRSQPRGPCCPRRLGDLAKYFLTFLTQLRGPCPALVSPESPMVFLGHLL